MRIKEFKKNVFQLLFTSGLVLSSTSFHTTAHATEPSYGSLGIGSLFAPQSTIEDHGFVKITPEIIVQTSRPIQGAWWYRPALRLGFGWNQPTEHMTQALQIYEYDWKLAADVAVVYHWFVNPSFSVGAGTLLRKTSLVTQEPIVVENDQISRVSFLPLVQAQLGVGIPIKKVVVIEPYTRYVHVFKDNRYRWAFGVDATFSIL